MADMTLATAPLSTIVPSHYSKPIQRVPVAKKAVPDRKPVGHGQTSTASPAQATETIYLPQPAAKTTLQANDPLQAVKPLCRADSNVGRQSGYFPVSPAEVTGEELPPGWTSAYDPDGRIFYLNHITKTSSWNNPNANPNPLPPGWEERTTPDGKVYYFHISSRMTTWERPSALNPISIPETSLETKQPIVLSRQLSSTSSDSTLDQEPISPLSSPGIEWETSDYNSPRSSRRRSNFSLSSLGSTSSKTLSRIKLPSSASSNAMVKGTVKGTKSAAKIGMKGVKVTGKTIKDNRKVIGLTLKVANLVLKNTTGIDMGGLEGFLEGGGEVGGEIDAGGEDLEECDDAGDDDGGDENEVEKEEVVVDLSAIECETTDEVCVDGTVISDAGCQDMQASECLTDSNQSTVIIEETSEGSVLQTDTMDTGYAAEYLVAQESTTDQITSMEQTTFQETSVAEQLTVEQEAAFSGGFSGETLWADDSTAQETTVKETTIEQTTIQETTVTEIDTYCSTSQETATTIVATEVDTTQVTTVAETNTQVQEYITDPPLPPPPAVGPPFIEPVAPTTITPPIHLRQWSHLYLHQS